MFTCIFCIGLLFVVLEIAKAPSFLALWSTLTLQKRKGLDCTAEIQKYPSGRVAEFRLKNTKRFAHSFISIPGRSILDYPR